MKKISSSVALFFLVICVTVPSFAQDKTEVPGIIVISDAPKPSSMFVRFFYFFNKALIQWWQNGGRTATRGKWTISVSEFYDEELQPRGVTIIITRFDPSHQIMLKRQLTDGRVATNGRVAADIVIAVIKTATEEGQK